MLAIQDLLRRISRADHSEEATLWASYVESADRTCPLPDPPSGPWQTLKAMAGLAILGVDDYNRSIQLRAEKFQGLYAQFLWDRGCSFMGDTPIHLNPHINRFFAGLRTTISSQKHLLHVPSAETLPDVAATVMIAVILGRVRDPEAVNHAALQLARWAEPRITVDVVAPALTEFSHAEEV